MTFKEFDRYFGGYIKTIVKRAITELGYVKGWQAEITAVSAPYATLHLISDSPSNVMTRRNCTGQVLAIGNRVILHSTDGTLTNSYIATLIK